MKLTSSVWLLVIATAPRRDPDRRQSRRTASARLEVAFKENFSYAMAVGACCAGVGYEPLRSYIGVYINSSGNAVYRIAVFERLA